MLSTDKFVSENCGVLSNWNDLKCKLCNWKWLRCYAAKRLGCLVAKRQCSISYSWFADCLSACKKPSGAIIGMTFFVYSVFFRPTYSSSSGLHAIWTRSHASVFSRATTRSIRPATHGKLMVTGHSTRHSNMSTWRKTDRLAGKDKTELY